MDNISKIGLSSIVLRRLNIINSFFLLLFMVLLTSCSHVVRKDGPPNFYVDETKVPNAVPKPEKLAKYGNMPSYRVFGKRYFTLRSSKNYNEIGVASWYGTLFHAQRTSSGEPYNMLSMTAAHKTLPLPTYVEVTNLKNHRQIIVKVNDRGPFESNRLIDLSYVAAKKLGMLGHGTALVRVKAIDPYTYGRKSQSNGQFNWVAHKKSSQRALFAENQSTHVFNSHGQGNKQSRSMYLQIGAFHNKSYAEKLQHRLVVLLGMTVQISHPLTKGKLYRVQIGPIKDVATANKITRRLKTLGIKPNKTYGV